MKTNQIFKALSHPIRRDVLARLKNGAMSAGDLAENYDVSKPTMSNHFAALKEAGLIYAQRDGVVITYHVNLTVAEEALAMIMGVLGDNPVSQKQDILQIQQAGESKT